MKTILKPAVLAVAAIFLAASTEAAVFSDLHVFTGNDGSYPTAKLVLSGNTLYGTTLGGGTNGAGTVFAVNADGSGFTNLYNFAGTIQVSSAPQGYAGLVLSSNSLYGTMTFGTNGYGSVFAINTDGTGFTNLYNFNSSYPQNDLNETAGLVLSGGTLYGRLL
jgi:uncharacterized repeat protein (TIGR03803 family)